MIARLRTARRFIINVLILLYAVPAWADVLELRDGQTLTGQYAGGSKEEVRFQVGSQALRFPLAEVSRLTIGTTAQADFGRAAKETLRQLKALASVTEGGTTYQNYSTRVEDAKIKIDQFLDEHKSSPIPKFNDHIADSLGFYVAASSAWNAKVARTGSWNLPRNPYVLRCAPLQQVITREINKKTSLGPGYEGYKYDEVSHGLTIEHYGIPLLWECARNSLLDAEKALSQ